VPPKISNPSCYAIADGFTVTCTAIHLRDVPDSEYGFVKKKRLSKARADVIKVRFRSDRYSDCATGNIGAVNEMAFIPPS
jgi:hypothetical protein